MSARRSRPPTRRPRGRLHATSLLALGLLLTAPVYALARLSARVDWLILFGVPLGLSLFLFLAYRSDKRRAEAGAWRIPEATLHLAALLGGWPGAFLAQRTFRHKTTKLSFQFVFWLIVLLHQFVAIDYLIGWRMTRSIF